MRSYVLPQGIAVRIAGRRRLAEQARRYLGAHAHPSDPRESEWTIQVGDAPRSPQPHQVAFDGFGETFWAGPVGDGAVHVRPSDGVGQVWDVDRQIVTVIGAPGSTSYHTVQSVYAAARLLGLLHAARSGPMAVLHAACVWTPAGAVLVCGPKGSGKTTLTLALMAQGAGYMASDRTIAWGADQDLTVCGWVASFRATPATFDLAVPAPCAGRIADYLRRRRSAQAYWFGGKFRFPPADLLELGGWRPRLGGRPCLLVELNPQAPTSPTLVELSKRETQAAWRRHQVLGRLPPGLALPHPLAAPPSGLAGVRLDGRAPPDLLARSILDRAEGLQGRAP